MDGPALPRSGAPYRGGRGRGRAEGAPDPPACRAPAAPSLSVPAIAHRLSGSFGICRRAIVRLDLRSDELIEDAASRPDVDSARILLAPHQQLGRAVGPRHHIVREPARGRST